MFRSYLRRATRSTGVVLLFLLVLAFASACSGSATATATPAQSSNATATPAQTSNATAMPSATTAPSASPTLTNVSSGGSQSSGAETVNVTEQDYSISVDKNVVAPGQITFNLSNKGPSEHEFIIFKTDLAPDKLPTKNGIVDESASGLTKVKEQQQYPAGETRTVTVNLDAGNYVLICNLPGHYLQGMHVGFTVTPNAAATQTAEAQNQPTATPAATGTPSAAGSQQGPTATPSPAQTVNVIEKNFDIFVDRESVPAGTIQFNLRNEGVSVHEFVIFKTDLPADQLPVKDAQVVENAPQLQKIDEQQQFPPGETRTLTVQLDPGHYVLICNLPDHYEQGMRIDLTVTGANGQAPTPTPQSAQATATPAPQATATPAAQTTVQVIEENYAILLNDSTIPAGEVSFQLKNEGPDQHEFVIFKTDLAADQLPVQNGQVVEDSPQLQKITEQQQYPSGETRTVTVNLDPGHYVLICNLPGHYEQGMHFGLTVKAAPQPSATVQVIEENYAILLSDSSVPAGLIQFQLKNQGPDQHEFVIFKTDLAADQLPVQNGQVVEDSPQLQKITEQQQYPSGETRTVTVNLDPGHYVLICNLPGHYEQGMHFGFTVTGTANNNSQAQTSSENNSQATATPAPQGTATPAAQTTVQVIEENYAILLSDSNVPAGQVTFDLQNQGPDQHEFVIFKTDLPADQLPVQNGQVVESSPQLQKITEQDKYAAGQSKTLTVNLDPGHYVFICNIVGHYQQGMYFGFTVTAPGSNSVQAMASVQGQAQQKINVIEENYKILLSHSSVVSGTVEFDLSNQGPDQHEFVIFKTDLPADQLPVKNGQVVEDSPQLQKITEQQQYPSGETRTVTVDLAPGHYVLICNLPGHYEQGMHFGFTVTAPASSNQSGSTTQAAQTTIQVIEENYALLLSHSTAVSGTIQFNLTNQGPDQHEFVIFKTDLPGDQLPVQNGQVVESSSQLQKITEQDQYPAGETRTVTVNLAPGHYVFICNIAGHYQQGMYFNFTVTAPNA